MNALKIRQRLHSYLEVAKDKKVKAIYSLVEEELTNAELELTPAFRADIEKRNAEYHSGNVKMISSKSSKKRIQKLLGFSKS